MPRPPEPLECGTADRSHRDLAEALRHSRDDGMIHPGSSLDGLAERLAPRASIRNAHRFQIPLPALAAAAAVAIAGLSYFFLRPSSTPPASEVLSKSLNTLPQSGTELTQLMLDPVRREVRALALHTRQATIQVRLQLPVMRAP